jgi:putative hemolysin
MMWVAAIAVVLVGLFLSGVFSGSETGLYCVNRLRIELGTRTDDPAALRLNRVLSDEQGALSVILIGTNVANYVTTSAVAFVFADLMGLADTQAEIYTILMVTPVVFVFGEVVPKNLFQLHADHLMVRVSAILSVADRTLRATGGVWFLKLLATGINRLIRAADLGAWSTPRRRVASLLQEALVGRVFGLEQSELVERVCQLSETPVHTVMVPLNRITMISASADRKEFLRLARRTDHARLPVFERRRTQVIGLVKVDELLRDDEWETVGERVEPVPSISPHRTVAVAIRSLQESRRGLAIVTDHGGRLLGIVTLTDLLEQLVG